LRLFATLHHLDCNDTPHTQNFEIWNSLVKIQESKKKIVKSFLKILLKGLMAQILVKGVSWESLYRIGGFLNFLKKILKEKLKKRSKICVFLGINLRAEIWHEHTLLVESKNCKHRFGIF
jgi:hypothetical protein